MERGERFVFVDARSADECKASGRKLPGAIRMLASEVTNNLKAIPQGRTVITYCDCPNGESCKKVAHELMKHGFLKAYPLAGGLDAWCRESGSIEEFDSVD